MKYKIIDFEFYGGIVKLFLGNENLTEWTGADWDENAEYSYDPVRPEYVARTILLVVNPDKFLVVPFDEDLGSHSFSKNAMRNNRYPFMAIARRETLPNEAFWSEDSRRYCLGDIIEVTEKIKFIPIGL